MNLKAFGFSLKEGIDNLGTNIWLTLASIMTVACTVFIFLIVYTFLANVSFTLDQIESNIGIQVFFNEDLSEEQIKEIAEKNFKSGRIKEMKFTSASEAWDKVKEIYFDNDDSLISAFEGDNPLQSSASYTIYLYDIEDEIDIVNRISNIEGVRKVNYLPDVISVMIDLKNAVSIVASALIVILGIISIILISNTILVTADARKKENEIKKLIGATNFMVRFPFIFEAIIIAFIGTTIPIVIVALSYDKVALSLIPADSLLPNMLNIISISNLLPHMAMISYSVTIGLSVIFSYLTIRTTVRV